VENWIDEDPLVPWRKVREPPESEMPFPLDRPLADSAPVKVEEPDPYRRMVPDAERFPAAPTENWVDPLVATRSRSAFERVFLLSKTKAALEATSVGVERREEVPEKIISRPSSVRVVEAEPTRMLPEA